jgi:ubiquinone biosynthesis protein COQ4
MQFARTDLPVSAIGLENQPGVPRFLRGLHALGRLAKNPDDTELALTAAMLLNVGSLAKLVDRFDACAEGRRLLTERPALDCEHVDLTALGALPEGSLGRAYSEFMRARGLTPEVFVAPKQIQDERIRYVAQRLRQTHDLWHVVTGYDTNLLGEIELQAFMFAQLGMPFSLLVGSLGILRSRRPIRAARRVVAAYRRGRQTSALCTHAWEREFSQPLQQVRAQIGLA